MRKNPLLQALMAGTTSAAIILATAAVAFPTRLDGLVWSIAAFGVAVAAMFFTLRVYYPPVVGVIAVIAILSSPHAFAAVTEPTRESYCLSGVLIAWSLLPLARPFEKLGIALWGVVFGAAIISSMPQIPAPRNLLLIPEWHIVLAMLGTFAAIRRRTTDPMGLWILGTLGGVGLLMPPAIQQGMLAPLVGLGGGRVLYRGTLTKSFRIPPPGWAMVLLAVAAIRSAVIMVTRAPHWDEYKNRIGLLIEQNNEPTSRMETDQAIEHVGLARG